MDYYAQVVGQYANGRSWSTARHIRSNQSLASLLVTWQNAWTAAWNDAAHGLNAIYPVGTSVTDFTVAQLGPAMQQTAKVENGAALPGTDVANSLPTFNSIVISWRAATIGRHDRGHMSLPAPAEDVVVQDKLTGPTIARVKAAIVAVQTAIQADGSTFFVVNRLPLKDGTPPGSVVTLTTPLVRDKLGKQAKRYRKEIAVYA
jgi:hypothetical protein